MSLHRKAPGARQHWILLLVIRGSPTEKDRQPEDPLAGFQLICSRDIERIRPIIAVPIIQGTALMRTWRGPIQVLMAHSSAMGTTPLGAALKRLIKSTSAWR